MKWKNEIFFHLQQFRTWIELQKPDHKIKKIKTNAELTEHKFNEWYKKTNIQWKSSAFNIFAQNEVVERGMYIIMKFFYNILKTYHIFIGFWNFFVENIVYILNRIFIKLNINNIIFYEVVNGVSSNIFNFRVLNCFFFVHVSKLLFRQKLDDRVWKNVFVEYENNNFWTIYNSLIKWTQFVKNVRFNELQIYYADKSKLFDDSINISKMLKHWIANDDNFLNDLKWNNFFKKNSTNSITNNVSDENNNDPNEQNEKKNVDHEINHSFNNILFIESSFSSISIDIMFSFDD